MSSTKPGTLIALVIVSVLIATSGLLYVRYVLPPTNVAYVSEEEGGIKIINLSALEVVRERPESRHCSSGDRRDV